MPTPIPTAASGCSCWPPRFPGASGCRCCSGWAGASAGGGRWRRLAQALLAVLGTGAVPVLHLRRQRPLDLRAARPAGLALLAADLLRALARSAGAAWRAGLPGADAVAVRAVPRLPAAGLARRAEVHRRAAGQRRRLARAAAGVLAEAAVLGSVLQRRAGATGGGQRAGWLRRDALLAIRSRSFGALPDEVRQRLRCRPPVGQYQLCQAWRRLAETTSAGRRSSRDAGRCAGGCGRCPGGGHRWCTGGSCGRGTGSRRWPCG